MLSEVFTTAVSLMRGKHFEESEKLFLECLAETPSDANVLHHYASLCAETGRHEQAIAVLLHVLAMEPYRADVLRMLSGCYVHLGEWESAWGAILKAHDRGPRAPHILWNLSLELLRQGDYKQGLELYRAGLTAGERKTRYHEPPWRGSDLSGKTLFVWNEQGFGDCIQFARFLFTLKQEWPEVTVVLEMFADLIALFRTLPCVDVIFREQQDNSIPYSFDEHISLMDLPGALGVTLENLGECCPMPYLVASGALVTQWRAKMDASAFGVRVGICAAGNPLGHNDKRRSIDTAELVEHLREPATLRE